MFSLNTFFLLFLNVFVMTHSINPELIEIRKAFDEHKDDPKKCKEYIAILENETTEEMIAYQAMFYFMMAKHAWLPTSKFGYFSKGKKILEGVIQKKPNNAELIFLRLIIQVNLPRFLNYYENIEADKAFINKALILNKIKDEDLVNRIDKALKEIPQE